MIFVEITVAYYIHGPRKPVSVHICAKLKGVRVAVNDIYISMQ